VGAWKRRRNHIEIQGMVENIKLMLTGTVKLLCSLNNDGQFKGKGHFMFCLMDRESGAPPVELASVESKIHDRSGIYTFAS